MDQIAGYLDAVTEQALIGWIANCGHPGRLEPVTCVGAGGFRQTVHPFIPRADVCVALQATGRFGFAIPRSVLRGIGPTITLLDRNGNALEGGREIALPPVSPPKRVSRPACVVLHIQKTAGTSLRTALAQAGGPGEVVFAYPDGFIGLTDDELGGLPIAQRAALRMVMGHTYFGRHTILPGRSDYATVLRSPAARLRSHYLHHLGRHSRATLGGSAIDLASLVTYGLCEEFDNLMVRMVAGLGHADVPVGLLDDSHVELALHNIRTRFRFVALVERFAEHAPALLAALGCPPAPLAVENACIVDDPAGQDGLDWAVVMRRNRFDQMLYDRVQSEGLCGRDLSLARCGSGGPPLG